jgi:hypothetical protein
MMAIRKGIRIIISPPGDLVDERVLFHEIVAKLMTMMSRGRTVL